MIQAQRVQEALDWFPEIQRDAFCMGDQTDQCLGGLFSSENTAAKSLGRGFNLPVFCLFSRPIYFYMAVSESIWKSKLDYVTVLPKDLQWLHRAHKVKCELLPCPAGPCMIWLLPSLQAMRRLTHYARSAGQPSFTLDSSCRLSPVSGWLLLIFSACVRAESLQSCLTFCNSMDDSPPGSSVHGTLQARVMKWVAMPSSRGSFWPREVYLLLMPPEKPVNDFFLVRPTPKGKSNASSSDSLFWWSNPHTSATLHKHSPPSILLFLSHCIFFSLHGIYDNLFLEKKNLYIFSPALAIWFFTTSTNWGDLDHTYIA